MNEPIAYINVEKRELEWAKLTRWETPTTVKMDKVPLYTKKEWVGLTEQEQSDIAWEKDKSRIWIVTATEAKLKEKNGG